MKTKEEKKAVAKLEIFATELIEKCNQAMKVYLKVLSRIELRAREFKSKLEEFEQFKNN